MEMINDIEMIIAEKTAEIELFKIDLKALKVSHDETKKILTTIQKIFPFDETMAKQIETTISIIYEIQDKTVAQINKDARAIEENKESIKKLNRALKALK